MWLLKEGKQKAQHYHNQSYRLTSKISDYSIISKKFQEKTEISQRETKKKLNLSSRHKCLNNFKKNVDFKVKLAKKSKVKEEPE